ncbi:MAG: hypothetical protein EVJ46_08175 [Candidatus Acididesulfobacter guangdongensis]|uniref:Uncharacterized protein n=1 Tax=Acididesulfobacter guangdongensis TaxID=2597225 RepID=A0A519BFV9_ACIG2|nr:MAG: hypothetical protein EVJ46_08175 [Candidatus Acididesulfobacter guangdongensis]
MIGTNPLPNYIALQYFIGQNKYLKKIWLICSEKNSGINQDSTKEYAESLQKYFSKENLSPDYANDVQKVEFQEIIYITNIGSKKAIENQLEKIAKNSNNGKLHLFFTGGSKAMSAYSYYYLKEKFKNKFDASYLSARDWKIIFDNEKNIPESIADKIKINFDYLTELHSFEIIKNTEKHYCSSIEFIEIIESDEIEKFYCNSDGYNRDIFKPYDDHKIMEKIFHNIKNEDSNILKAAASDNCLNEEENKIKTDADRSKFKKKVDIFRNIIETLNYRPNETFMKIINSFPEDCRIYYYDSSEKPNFNTKIEYKKYNDAIEFLDGFWLEQYIKKINFKDNFDEILFNKELYKSSGGPENKFELDGVLMKGCQLIGVSCTTSKN